MVMSLKKPLIYLLVVSLITFGAVFLLTSGTEEKKDENIDIISYVTIGETKIEVEIANTKELRAKGLSETMSLNKKTGMLFIFEEEGIYPFWMKRMRFPIDIIWIDKNLQIVDITKNATPKSYPKTFSPKKPSKYVLEINTGLLNQYDINIADYLSLNIK